MALPLTAQRLLASATGVVAEQAPWAAREQPWWPGDQLDSRAVACAGVDKDVLERVSDGVRCANR